MKSRPEHSLAGTASGARGKSASEAPPRPAKSGCIAFRPHVRTRLDRIANSASARRRGWAMVEWFDDLVLGMRFKNPEKRVTREEIKRFAAEYDPQPYHIDEAAAEGSPLKGLAASGWHTAAIAMGLMVETRPFGSHPSSDSASTSCGGWRQCVQTISSILKAKSLSSRRRGQSRRGSCGSSGRHSISGARRSTRSTRSPSCRAAPAERAAASEFLLQAATI